MPPKTKGILKKSGRRIDRKNGNVNVEASPATERNKVRYSKVAQEGFTKDEIKAIVDRHKFLVEDMNKYLPEEVNVEGKEKEKVNVKVNE